VRPLRITAILVAVALSVGLCGGVAGCRAHRAAPAQRETQARSQPASAPRSAPAHVAEGDLFSTEERAAVEEFLGRNRDLRVATDADRRGARSGDGDVRGLYGVYHPYFVRGDLNDDGILDFVLAFVHRGSTASTPWFSIVVFTGRGSGQGYNPGVFLERDVSLARGDVSIDRDAVVVTPDLSDDATRRYRWDPVHGSYIFVRDDDDDEDDAPLPAQT